MAGAGRASLRREFNLRLWACNRERALAVIDEYCEVLAHILRSRGLAGLTTPSTPSR